MKITDLFDKVHTGITLGYKDNLHNLDEVYILPNLKVDDEFYLIVKQNNKYSALFNYYKYFSICTPSAILKTKFHIPYVYNRIGQLTITTDGNCVTIMSEQSVQNA